MRKFDAWGVAMLLHHIDERREFTRKIINEGPTIRDARIAEEVDGQCPLNLFEGILTLAEAHAREYGFQSTLDRVCDTGPFRMAVKTKLITWQQMEQELTVLRQAVEADLEKHLFAFVAPSKSSVMLGITKHPWDEIVEHFPEIETDLIHAGECYAFEQNTACVFHLMRVAEYGLRNIAASLHVTPKDKKKNIPIEYATWDKVISGINSKIAAARLLPHGKRKAKKLQFYSNAAENCSYLRDLWRNDVAHARKEYNEGEAFGVFNRVRDFMHLLSSQRP